MQEIIDVYNLSVPSTVAREIKRERMAPTIRDDASDIRDQIARKNFRQLVFLIFPLSLITTECTIYWNHLDDVYSIGSVGQLVPLVLGIGLMVYMSVCTTLLEESSTRLHRLERELENWDVAKCER